MARLTVTAKGQVTLRKEVLQHLGVKPGDKIELSLVPDAKGVIMAARSNGAIDAFLGLLAGQSEKVAVLEEINEATSKAWSGRE